MHIPNLSVLKHHDILKKTKAKLVACGQEDEVIQSASICHCTLPSQHPWFQGTLKPVVWTSLLNNIVLYIFALPGSLWHFGASTITAYMLQAVATMLTRKQSPHPMPTPHMLTGPSDMVVSASLGQKNLHWKLTLTCLTCMSRKLVNLFLKLRDLVQQFKLLCSQACHLVVQRMLDGINTCGAAICTLSLWPNTCPSQKYAQTEARSNQHQESCEYEKFHAYSSCIPARKCNKHQP